jgi:hypothetical protein
MPLKTGYATGMAGAGLIDRWADVKLTERAAKRPCTTRNEIRPRDRFHDHPTKTGPDQAHPQAGWGRTPVNVATVLKRESSELCLQIVGRKPDCRPSR